MSARIIPFDYSEPGLFRLRRYKTQFLRLGRPDPRRSQHIVKHSQELPLWVA